MKSTGNSFVKKKRRLFDCCCLPMYYFQDYVDWCRNNIVIARTDVAVFKHNAL